MGDAFTGDAELIRIVTRVAPGTGLRDGIERILRGRTGALIVVGYDAAVEEICDGGFHLDIEFAPTRLRELAKMDGAVVLSTDGTRILRANVQLVPDSAIPTEESGTRHRAAERTAVQTGYPVISVSASMSIAHAYVAGSRQVIEDAAPILARADLAISTLARYRHRLDQSERHLTRSEIEDQVTVREAAQVVQRLELVRRMAVEIEEYVLKLGSSGRQIALQLEDLLGDAPELDVVLRDYLPEAPATGADLAAARGRLRSLDDTALLDLTIVAAALHRPSTLEGQDLLVSPRGFRLLGSIPRLAPEGVAAAVTAFGSLQYLLAASAADLEAVEGVGDRHARNIREGLSRVVESAVDRFA